VAKVTAVDVDLDAGTWTLDKWKNSKKQKGKKRVIYLVPEMLEMTRRLVALYPEGPLFRNQLGDPWTKPTLTARFRRLAERTGIEELTAYVVRHCYMTDALARGVPIAGVAELCGTSVQTIQKHYAHLDQKKEQMRQWASQAIAKNEAGLLAPPSAPPAASS
jgi:integrase